jgi:predicted metal-dependent HD superfamily phosphohydrolase
MTQGTRFYRRWVTLWQRVGAPGGPERAYTDLRLRYAEPHRAYHTFGHIAHCLDELDQSGHHATNVCAVELALWYHDAIYDPRATNNEQQSAALALKAARNTSRPADFWEHVRCLILATRHDSVPSDINTRLVVDIDLAILGQAESRFSAYERGIRTEYAWVSEVDFVRERGAILQSLLDRPAIYATPYFQDRYERQARLNIARSLERLRTRLLKN